LDIPLHISTLVLVSRAEGPSHRIEDNQYALATALFFKFLDGHGQRFGIDNAASQVELATDDNERDALHAMFLAPCRNSPFRELLRRVSIQSMLRR
jgi:hypothetical protein